MSKDYHLTDKIRQMVEEANGNPEKLRSLLKAYNRKRKAFCRRMQVEAANEVGLPGEAIQVLMELLLDNRERAEIGMAAECGPIDYGVALIWHGIYELAVVSSAGMADERYPYLQINEDGSFNVASLVELIREQATLAWMDSGE